jgi:phosphoenolpyruvate-protein kinase (PTS system EI component)
LVACAIGELLGGRRECGKELKCGICGEHGGDPKSVEFCHQVGLNYVSCSPFRVPIARLAAHAVIKQGAKRRQGKSCRLTLQKW